MQLTAVLRRSSQRLLIQHFFHGARTILGGIDKHDLASEHSRNRVGEQRIMRATEDKGVDPTRKQGPEVARDHLVGHVIVEQSFFDQRDEQWTCTTTYAHIVIS